VDSSRKTIIDAFTPIGQSEKKKDHNVARYFSSRNQEQSQIFVEDLKLEEKRNHKHTSVAQSTHLIIRTILT
jgi:hypothetical protein